MFLIAGLQGTMIAGNDAHAVPGPDGGPGLLITTGQLELSNLQTQLATVNFPTVNYEDL